MRDINLPANPEDLNSSIPTGSVWADGSGSNAHPAVDPEMWESDPGLFNDDAMGSGAWNGTHPGGGPVVRGVVQAGSGINEGTLYGPNLINQTGVTEGDCIEVYISVPYYAPIIEAGVVVGWTLEWWESKTKTVCVADPATCP